MLAFFTASGILKNTPRKGWAIRGIENGESVAEHMYQMGLICLAYPWSSDAARVHSVEMAIVHDAPEAIAGDIVPSDNISKEMKHTRESLGLDFLRCLARQGGNIEFANRMRTLWDEYEDCSSTVAKVVHQIDKLEALQQAYLYAVRYPGQDLDDFKRLRENITDRWLLQQADEILDKWNALELRTKSRMPIIFIVGGPGVGKGTQCALAADQLNLEHISVGELLRAEEKNSESVFSGFISKSFHQNIAVPAMLTMHLLGEKLRCAQEEGKAGVLIDGFPRSLEQLQGFEQEVTKKYATIAMECPDEILQTRLLHRAVSSGRDDDNPDSIARRVQGHHAGHETLTARLSLNWLTKTECQGSVEEVQIRFQKALQDAIQYLQEAHNKEVTLCV